MRLLLRSLLPIVLVGAASAAAEGQDAAQSIQAIDASAAAPEVVRTKPRMDKNHPLKVDEGLYPIESRNNGEKGTCLMRVQVDQEGFIRAAQLVFSSGFVRLDAACFQAFMDRKMIPATVDGKPISKWINIPVTWGAGIPINQKPDYSTTPHLDDDFHLKVGPEYYPTDTREHRQQGKCLVHVTVTPQGTPRDVAVTISTGYAALDAACINAIRDADFIPGVRGEMAVAGSTDIYMSWRLSAP